MSKIVVRFPSDLYLVSHVLVIAFNSLLIVPTVMLNIVSVTAIMKSTRLRSKPCYFLVVIQSVVDLIVGSIGIPLFIFYVVSPIVGFLNCTVSFVTAQTFFIPSAVSIITLSAMTVERYIGVLHPYAYTTKVTKGKIMAYECCGCFLIILLFGVSLPLKRVITYFSTFLILVFFILNAYVYSRIYAVVVKIARSDKAQNRNLRDQNSSKRKTFIDEIKQAKSCFLVLMCFVVCFLPLALTSVVSPSGFDHVLYQIWSMTSIMLNSSLNSVIFFWTKRELRVQALHVLKRNAVTP
ncbi:cannabinoid receptor type 1A-like [Dendronephthya gigantea]|uniref:cannabinoid receptor type 1A-like n=1 Tax=Dendronephthya gigantea TaxID=151771 RepID=UPI00106A113B|nr:cannabinoid receptor type 1A-like [Dendronephthya gigantea]